MPTTSRGVMLSMRCMHRDDPLSPCGNCRSPSPFCLYTFARAALSRTPR